MNIRCRHCKAKLNIPDHKRPKDREASFKCPKCGERVRVPPAGSIPDSPPPGPADPPAAGDAADRFALQGKSRALILADPQLKKACLSAVDTLGYLGEAVDGMDAAMEKMAYQIYPLVILSAEFHNGQGRDRILSQMNDQDMSLRRKTCLILIDKGMKTGDHMAAMHASVNSIIGADGVPHLPALLSEAITDHQNFYRVFNDSLKAVGKA